jgi:hypothetical protein
MLNNNFRISMVLSFILFATWNIFTYNSLAYKKLHADSDWIKIVLVTIMAFWVYATTTVAKKNKLLFPTLHLSIALQLLLFVEMNVHLTPIKNIPFIDSCDGLLFILNFMLIGIGINFKNFDDFITKVTNSKAQKL